MLFLSNSSVDMSKQSKEVRFMTLFLYIIMKYIVRNQKVGYQGQSYCVLEDEWLNPNPICLCLTEFIEYSSVVLDHLQPCNSELLET